MPADRQEMRERQIHRFTTLILEILTFEDAKHPGLHYGLVLHDRVKAHFAKNGAPVSDEEAFTFVKQAAEALAAHYLDNGTLLTLSSTELFEHIAPLLAPLLAHMLQK